ncbi:MAG: hypothetical protein HY669_00380 [Chloroflexi bacterium]|nr:hypothetical protein [Chloroflexota bacterium]
MVELRKEVSAPLPLDANIPPARERRVGAINAWAGTAKQLIEETNSGSLKVYDRTFSQGWTCSHIMGGHVQCADIADAVTLVHSATGCTVWLLQRQGSHFWYPKQKMDSGGVVFTPGQAANWYGTNLTEEDVIFGGENKLRDTIKAIDKKHKPKAIFITNSCAAGIMGDDLEGVMKTVQPEVNAIIVPVRCEPTQSRICQQGQDAFGHAILKYLVKEPQQKQTDLVNMLCGPGIEWTDRAYLAQMLAKAGIRVNAGPRWSSVEQLQTLGEAAGSTALCPTFVDYMIKGLHQKCGVPYFRDTVPFGIAETEAWLRKVAQFVGKEKEIEDVIAEERAAVMPQVEALRRQLQGVKFFISGGQTRTLFLPIMLVQDFGMELVGINPYEWDEPAVEDLEKLGRAAGNLDFFVHVGDDQNFETVNYLKKLDVDLAILHRGQIGAMFKYGSSAFCRIFIESHRLRKEKGASLTLGFKGVVAYGRFLARAVKNPSYQKKLAPHVKLPYKESWYEQDAFSQFKGLE